MVDTLTGIFLFILMLAALLAWAVMILRLKQVKISVWLNALPVTIAWAVTVACLGLFVYRWLWAHQSWVPLTAHVDGLLLICVMLGLACLFMEYRPNLRAVNLCVYPFWAFMLGWAWCAATWTYHPFVSEVQQLWQAVHLTTVYIGTAIATFSAICGVTYLYAQRRLRHKDTSIVQEQWTSLETLENLVIRSATLGFVLLSLGLASGWVMIASKSHKFGVVWYESGKVWLALAAWLTFALIMNVHYATSFRGARAAWMSIIGLILLLGTYALVLALPSRAVPDALIRHEVTEQVIEQREAVQLVLPREEAD